MERYLLTVESNSSDPSREKDFNDWYDTVHLPDILEIPGFVSAARYENTSAGEGQGKFLAVYEIECEDLGQALASFDETVNRKAKEGRMSDLLVAVGGGLYRQITAPVEGK